MKTTNFYLSSNVQRGFVIKAILQLVLIISLVASFYLIASSNKDDVGSGNIKADKATVQVIDSYHKIKKEVENETQ